MLRFGLPYVTVSDIVEQAFCEYRVVQRYLGGHSGGRRRDLRRVVEATATLLSSARGDGCRGYSSTIAAVVEGVPVVGRPDLLLFRDGALVGVVWSRVGGRRGVGFYDRLRLYLYGLLADYAGFDVSRMVLYLIVASSKARLVDGVRLVYWLAGCGGRVSVEGVDVYRLVYDRDVALDYVGGLLSFWRSDREPRGPRAPSVCVSCQYAGSCSLRAALFGE